MATMSPNPCAEGHQELALMLDVTAFGDSTQQMRCNRCGNTLDFEDAVRNDERIRIAAAIEDMEIDQFGSDYTILLDAAKIARRGGR